MCYKVSITSRYCRIQNEQQDYNGILLTLPGKSKLLL
ncbi:hypothetical protein G4228_014466 [Cervus hanglu yarkandensis]|nr:hypothetical protein G4228_014466 [Cervus hanglu yarkandensis]